MLDIDLSPVGTAFGDALVRAFYMLLFFSVLIVTVFSIISNLLLKKYAKNIKHWLRVLLSILIGVVCTVIILVIIY